MCSSVQQCSPFEECDDRGGLLSGVTLQRPRRRTSQASLVDGPFAQVVIETLSIKPITIRFPQDHEIPALPHAAPLRDTHQLVREVDGEGGHDQRRVPRPSTRPKAPARHEHVFGAPEPIVEVNGRFRRGLAPHVEGRALVNDGIDPVLALGRPLVRPGAVVWGPVPVLQLFNQEGFSRGVGVGAGMGGFVSSATPGNASSSGEMAAKTARTRSSS